MTGSRRFMLGDAMSILSLSASAPPRRRRGASPRTGSRSPRSAAPDRRVAARRRERAATRASSRRRASRRTCARPRARARARATVSRAEGDGCTARARARRRAGTHARVARADQVHRALVQQLKVVGRVAHGPHGVGMSPVPSPSTLSAHVLHDGIHVLHVLPRARACACERERERERGSKPWLDWCRRIACASRRRTRARGRSSG